MNGEWIPVKRKLPIEGQEVLAVVRLGRTVTCGLATYDDRQERDERWIGVESLEPFVGTVTHWMPLPKLPRPR